MKKDAPIGRSVKRRAPRIHGEMKATPQSDSRRASGTIISVILSYRHRIGGQVASGARPRRTPLQGGQPAPNVACSGFTRSAKRLSMLREAFVSMSDWSCLIAAYAFKKLGMLAS